MGNVLLLIVSQENKIYLDHKENLHRWQTKVECKYHSGKIFKILLENLSHWNFSPCEQSQYDYSVYPSLLPVHHTCQNNS